ncbi:FecR family protein [Mucilaginibacter mallensis]|uniref:FecR family protein n=1 Tax=Mucilaginibacter mallensis TaxID=652787 RepID=A0A1H1UKP0_MUCMA|nr:FecR domain-containing protein [Mucilaginibacter mallensis]SDS72880.1 FecR family protein [Mucilaginibacter mallensis]
MEEEYYYKLLVQRFTDRTATDEELEVFIKLVNEGKLDAYLTEVMNEEAGITENDEPVVYAPAKTRTLWPRIAAAASILLAISAGSYFMLHKPSPPRRIAQIQSQEIVPGRNQATLTLANGQKIILSKGLSGKLAQQGNTQINVNSASEVVYTHSGSKSEVQYNTLSTAVGEASPYPLVLPDGTKVWLNSKSSITFPTVFTGSKRHVEITGEVYFEVKHNASNPFTVKAGNQTVEDIGTAFNINSYGDEPTIKTTLVEGSAKVIANGTEKLLQPGQHTLVTQQSFQIQTADSEAETAWMSGRFIFHDEELHTAMRQLARWYNINVIYDYNPKNILLGGGFSKSRNINKVLNAFEQTGAVKFKIEGHTVHITE